jgi:hypothetical protein
MRGREDTTVRHLLLLALIGALLTGSAHAQPVVPDPAASPVPIQARRVLIDTTFLAIPPAVDAPCMSIEAGHLLIQATTVLPDRPAYPTTLSLTGYRGEDPAARADVPITQDTADAVMTVVGGLYCWTILVDAPVSFDDSMSVRTNYGQGVALKMTLFQP